MNRSHFFDYIEDKLSHLVARIEHRGKLNLLDLHNHSEDFYLHFFNELLDWQLQNINDTKANATTIDLIDNKNKIVVQVSATATKEKVESALTKDLSPYTGYAFKFISISKDAGALRGKLFANPHNLTFDPKTDIHDVPSILKIIRGLDTDKQRRIYVFIKKELGSEADPQKLESNLAAIINILAKENWSLDASPAETIPFNIDKKIDYNKSTSVLDAIRRDYLIQKSRLSGDDLFFGIVVCVLDRIKNSVNYEPIPYEELELCVNIMVVDAFIRCKIFKNPTGYADAAS